MTRGHSRPAHSVPRTASRTHGILASVGLSAKTGVAKMVNLDSGAYETPGAGRIGQ